MAAVLAATPAIAQDAQPPSPLSRADVTATLGWFNAEKGDIHDVRSYNDWYNRSLHAGFGAGWYWTDNLKTEVDFGATTKGRIYTSQRVLVDNRETYTNSQYFFSTRKIAVGQVYQFYRNQFFHPHLAAGVDVTWEKIREESDGIYVFDPVNRVSRRETPPFTRRDTDVIARPYAAAGFKAYMSPRAFFRSDLRVTVRGGIDEVLLRFGFGVDF